MRIIALAGLAAGEKSELALDLARHFSEAGRRVHLIDNMQHMTIPTDRLPPAVTYQRIHDLGAATTAATEAGADVMLLAVAEQAAPDELFALLDTGAVDVRVLAIVDDRTCDCFPTLRQTLEDHADAVLRPPFTLREALEHL